VNVTADQAGGSELIDCTVLMPVFNEERYIEQSVAAMCRQRFEGQIEFICADGGSDDRTRAILEQLSADDPRIQVVDNPNRTVSSGLNVALRHARGRWVARMDAHTEYPEDYIELGVERLARGGTRWVSGPQVPKGQGPVSRAVALSLGSRLGRGGSRKWGTRDSANGAEYELDSGVFAGVWERATLEEYGGWDERWAKNEDSEMAGRFLAGGERLICLPAMSASYAPRDSLLGLWRQYLDYGEYRTKTAVRHPHTMRASALLAPALVIDAGFALFGPRRLRSAARGGLALYLAALAFAAVRSVPAAQSPADAALVPVVLALMHYGHGTGMILGMVRHGVPAAALATVLGPQRSATPVAASPDPVFAPSLE
jgi:succinoglycan biosynthesis protein ExoA